MADGNELKPLEGEIPCNEESKPIYINVDDYESIIKSGDLLILKRKRENVDPHLFKKGGFHSEENDSIIGTEKGDEFFISNSVNYSESIYFNKFKIVASDEDIARFSEKLKNAVKEIEDNR